MHSNQPQGRGNLTVVGLFIAGVLLGSLALLATRPYGLGVSTDSVDYMFTGLNLSQGAGFTSYNGRPFALWPPLYPCLLALTHLLTRQDMLRSALIVHLLTLIFLAAAQARLFNRLFPGRRLWPALGVMLTGLAPVYLTIAQNVASDYLFVLFTVLFFVDAGQYLETHDSRALLRIFLWGMLAALQRYIGVSLIFSAALVVLGAAHGSLRRRLFLSGVQLLAAAPLLLWLARNMRLQLGVFGVRGVVALQLSELLAEIWRLFTGWFIYPFASPVLLALQWLGFGALSVLVVTVTAAGYRTRRLAFRHPLTPILIFAGVYSVFILMTLSKVQVTSIQDRFLAPLYIPTLLLLLHSLDTLESWLHGRASRARPRRAVAPMLALIPISWLFAGAPTAATLITSFDAVSLNYGNMYNNSQWANKGVIVYLKENPFGANDVLYSNIPAGVAFHTWRPVLHSPRSSSVLQPRQAYDLAPYAKDFRHPGKSLYLIWVEPNYYEHVYKPVQLRQILLMKKLVTDQDGGAVFRVAPLNNQ